MKGVECYHAKENQYSWWMIESERMTNQKMIRPAREAVEKQKREYEESGYENRMVLRAVDEDELWSNLSSATLVVRVLPTERVRIPERDRMKLPCDS